MNPNFLGFSDHEQKKVLSHISKLKVYREFPKFEVHNDVIFVPQLGRQAACLYTKEGKRIDTSCIRRGIKQKMAREGPELISVEQMPYIPRKFIFAGELGKPHYGHLITEGISRLWFCDKEKYPEHKILANSSRISNDLLKLAGIDAECESFDKRVILEEVIIPYPSFSNRAKAYTAHADIMERAAKKALKGSVTKATDQPLYLSRRLLGSHKRQIKNEEVVEDYLAKRGVKIAYPEKLSLIEQISLVNRHQVIIGPIGSALHSTLFSLGNPRVIALSRFRINGNYLLIDKLKSNKATYINCMLPDKDCKKEGHPKSVILDTKKAIHFLDRIMR